MIACFWASVTSVGQAGLSSPLRQRKTVIWSSLPHWSEARVACWLSRTPRPTRVRETKRVRMTARCIDRLRRSPWPSSVKTYRSCMSPFAGSVLEAVDALALVAHDPPGVQLDDALAHLVHDPRVVRGHEHRGAGAVDPIQDLHDPDRGGRVQVSG